ncbi:hypothetical protein R3P38DRAFT_1079369 [Favolaschia claudopus]|uniref:Uncharacterized protein n=1 Tax=Favolaschia claudopus TaxID=2862362 RepID=A0AAW0BF22_9AGAR
MSSAIPHVVAFLTAPLPLNFSDAAVSSARLILTASLAAIPSATFIMNQTSTLPEPLLAASIGAGIPWAAWLAALGSDQVLLFYGPGFVRVRLGSSPVKDIWGEQGQHNILSFSRVQTPTKIRASASPLLQQNTAARLRATLLSARVRSMRREQVVCTAVVEPVTDSDSDLESDSDSDDSDSDSASWTSSKFTSRSTESLTSAGSPPTSPVKPVASVALPAATPYRPPFARARAAAADASISRPKPTTSTAYLYQGGVTRVMTGGVMLGSHHVVRATRS